MQGVYVLAYTPTTYHLIQRGIAGKEGYGKSGGQAKILVFSRNFQYTCSTFNFRTFTRQRVTYTQGVYQ